MPPYGLEVPSTGLAQLRVLRPIVACCCFCVFIELRDLEENSSRDYTSCDEGYKGKQDNVEIRQVWSAREARLRRTRLLL